jgi:hypothetical protein
MLQQTSIQAKRELEKLDAQVRESYIEGTYSLKEVFVPDQESFQIEAVDETREVKQRCILESPFEPRGE